MRCRTCVIDGVFSQDAAGDLQFHPATELSPTDVVAVQTLVCRRVLSLFERKGLLTPKAADQSRWIECQLRIANRSSA